MAAVPVMDLSGSEWVLNHKRDGTIRRAMRTFYVCLGCRGRCCGLVPATGIEMLQGNMSEAVLAGRRWYCRGCGSRHRAQWGLLHQLWCGDDRVYWLRSDLPSIYDHTPPVDMTEMVASIPARAANDPFLRDPREDEIIPGGGELHMFKPVNEQEFLDMRVWQWSEVVMFAGRI